MDEKKYTIVSYQGTISLSGQRNGILTAESGLFTFTFPLKEGNFLSNTDKLSGLFSMKELHELFIND